MKRIFIAFLVLLWASPSFAETGSAREILERLAFADRGEYDSLLEELSDTGDPFIKEYLEVWRVGEVYEFQEADGKTSIVISVSGEFKRLADNGRVNIENPEDERLKKNRPSRTLRRGLKQITDTIDLSSPDPQTRIDAALKLGLSQNLEYLQFLRTRLSKEENDRVATAIDESIQISLLANAKDDGERLNAVNRLGELESLPSRDEIVRIGKEAEESGNAALASASGEAVKKIDYRQKVVERWGNLVRGLSLGSVLLIVAFGLAITFGLMGIINMAHGEFIAIGAYTCYQVNIAFEKSFGVQSEAYQWFYWVSLPLAFLVAAAIGFILEKGLFQFLYKRPLESLLATWGLSMIFQQCFRLIFGAANVQVNTPDALIGNLEFGGVALSYTRLFIVAFAGFVILMTWLLLSKTNLGLYIRAVMQNRQMAASLGIPVKWVNSLTFAYGCGLAALAGAALSQIGNVGPSMGQAYIVDSFMVVVVGGVGNLLGAGISALGIGTIDQFMQPLLGPVMGKIVVFFAIILFLQRKPGGLFPAKSRSMD